ncbi:cupin domain-containing protein [Actinomyces vulturis]|uniref:cupin domain-containing protein n=1 Tax=Actinomyces vulturis TaxID=1857645 RepID=UPI00082A4BCC|nr:cupin domain-containing protein [Actinomyces vulturis]
MPSTPVSQSTVTTDILTKLPIVQEATTSRVVVNNDVLRQVLFSFDTGQVLTEHASPRAVIVQMIHGRIRFEVAGESSVVTDGDVIYLAPNERHALEALEPSHMALTLVAVNSD